METETTEQNETVVIPKSELSFTASRAGGPGGQHVNKTSTKVTLHWNVSSSTALTDAEKGRVRSSLGNRINAEGELAISVDESRSQRRNREIALERLVELLAKALKVQKKRRPTRPSRRAKARRVEGKRKQSVKKAARKAPGANE